MIQTQAAFYSDEGKFDLGRTVFSCLPKRIGDDIVKCCDVSLLCEIRLHRDRRVSVTEGDSNIICDTVCTAAELEGIIFRMCRGSLHSFSDSILRGYIPLPGGCRAGLCGRAVTDKGKILSVKEITSLNIRIPRNIRGVSSDLCGYLSKNGFSESALIYSPPGIGKTTLLSDIALSLSSPPYTRRVALIDCRCELYREEVFRDSAADVYLSYPKALAIEMATRTMSPQVIICDEIGMDEADAMIGAQNSGVPLIASAHALSAEALIRRPAFALLHSACVFDNYIGLSRKGGEFSFDIKKRSEIV